ncbi:MAG: tRNA pseudouridine(55) synthase TruB [Planctomycetota bacterium]
MFGLLNLNKPKGLTSRDAVNRVQWLVRHAEGEGGKPISKKRASKVGHAGTLDPIATGVLVVCIGPATRLIEHVQRMPKRYRGTFLLGQRSPSDDVELEPESLTDPPVPTREQIGKALPAFVGEIEQVPPAYSAIKIDGQKAYDLARAGDAPEMKPRPVTIHRLEVVRYEYPELVLDIRCGSGTYIRSLGRDLAASLGTAAVMSGLARTAIGDFVIDHGVDPRTLDEASLANAMIRPEAAVADLQRVDLTAGEAALVRAGRPIAPRDDLTPRELAMFTPEGELLALGKKKRGGQLWPVRVFRAGNG